MRPPQPPSPRCPPVALPAVVATCPRGPGALGWGARGGAGTPRSSGGAGSGDVPPHSQPPHTSVGPVRPVSPSPLVLRRPLVRVPSYSTAAPQAQVVAIGGRCVVSTWWGEEASMALAAAAVLEGAVAHPPPPN